MREKLIDLIMDLPITRITYEEMEKYSEVVADYLIANGVTISVRCKDCKYQGRASCPTYYEDRMTYRDCWALDGDNDFCSYGERKDNETD